MARRSVADLLRRVREVLQDQDQDNYRYATTSIVAYLNDAVFEARRLRPDLFQYRFEDDVPQVDENPATDYSTVDMPLPDQYFSACVDFCAGRVELRDDEFATDGRAMTFVNSFSQKLMGGA